MSLRVYNTLSREKELFDPVKPGKVGMYLCGPTVYKSPHVGHMVGPVIFDAVKRYLLFKGYEVTLVVNITDVDDKLIDAAARAGTTVADLAAAKTKEYFDALAALGVDTIDLFPKASEHIVEILDMCTRLINQGFAYASNGNVWFEVRKDDDYGKLSNRTLDEQESGLRELEGAGKRNPADFALWKAAKPGEPAWESPWGPGRPGWHIECSAMSMKILGESFDIHGGGMDLLFPHHENELAQSESCTGKPFARYWMHNGLTRMNTKRIDAAATAEPAEPAAGKISGSALQGDDPRVVAMRNLVDVRRILADFGPDVLRYLLLSTHYRRPIEFGDDALTEARKGHSAFARLFERVDRLGATITADTPDIDASSAQLLQGEHEHFVRDVLAFKMKFLEMMDDDFNTAGAIGVLHQLASEINRFIETAGVERDKHADDIAPVVAATMTLRRLGQLLGLFRTTSQPPRVGDLSDKLLDLLVKLRNDARKQKQFAIADAVRDGLTAIGVTLEDRADGTFWRK